MGRRRVQGSGFRVQRPGSGGNVMGKRVGFAISVALCVLGSSAASTTRAAERPNIVFIYADDLSYAGLSVTGASEIKTPHIDSLAANGVRFTDSYVTGCVCSPSRAALLTGRYQQRF